MTGWKTLTPEIHPYAILSGLQKLKTSVVVCQRRSLTELRCFDYLFQHHRLGNSRPNPDPAML
jgi:hypothetical protein